MPCHYRHRVRPVEWRLTGEHFVQHTSKTVLVAASINFLCCECLFGTHVQRSAEHDAGLCECLRGIYRIQCAGESKIRDECVTFLKKNVFRLDVAVNDLPSMS